MMGDIDNYFPDEASAGESGEKYSLKGISLAEKHAQELAKKNLLARKRIDELRENKRLKDLLDDSKDW